MPSCGINCSVIRQPIGNFPPPPPLVRSTHRECINCNRSVSDYSHNYCYSCALPNSIEYLYHHRMCTPNAPNAPTAPQAPLSRL